MVQEADVRRREVEVERGARGSGLCARPDVCCQDPSVGKPQPQTAVILRLHLLYGGILRDEPDAERDRVMDLDLPGAGETLHVHRHAVR